MFNSDYYFGSFLRSVAFTLTNYNNSCLLALLCSNTSHIALDLKQLFWSNLYTLDASISPHYTKPQDFSKGLLPL